MSDAETKERELMLLRAHAPAHSMGISFRTTAAIIVVALALVPTLGSILSGRGALLPLAVGFTGAAVAGFGGYALMKRVRLKRARQRHAELKEWIASLPFPTLDLLETIENPKYWHLEFRLSFGGTPPKPAEVAKGLSDVIADVAVHLRDDGAKGYLVHVYPGRSLALHEADPSWVNPWYRRVVKEYLGPLHAEVGLRKVAFTPVPEGWSGPTVEIDNRKH